MADEQPGRAATAPMPMTPGIDVSPVDLFTSVFPWMRSLSPADQETCARDLASAAGTDSLVAELRSWKETAATVAAGYCDVELEWLN